MLKSVEASKGGAMRDGKQPKIARMAPNKRAKITGSKILDPSVRLK